jgi:hypothetical protein
MKKTLLTIILTVVVCFAVVGATFAWLMDKTDPITNTFTVGNVDIELTESANLDLKMVPGKVITKDPKVTVNANSEACWLFVKVEETNNIFDTNKQFVKYEIDDTNWKALDGESGVYYIKVDEATAKTGVDYDVLHDNQVTINTAATADDLAVAETSQPTLKFTAYAVQSEGINNAAAAWAIALNEGAPTT